MGRAEEGKHLMQHDMDSKIGIFWVLQRAVAGSGCSAGTRRYRSRGRRLPGNTCRRLAAVPEGIQSPAACGIICRLPGQSTAEADDKVDDPQNVLSPESEDAVCN